MAREGRAFARSCVESPGQRRALTRPTLLIQIREEIRAIEDGKADKADNPLKHAPHPIHVVAADEWTHKYSRSEAAYPAAWLHDAKFWPPVARIDNPYGDRHLICTCPPMSEME